jgi:lysophospholipase L1-like esterase
VHERLPGTRVAFLPIKPSIARWSMWHKMQAANSFVEQLATTDERLIYIDTTTPMLGTDGQPRKELFLDDGLHLNGRGYEAWNEVLAPILKSLAAEE